jgi:hypothetical protein
MGKGGRYGKYGELKRKERLKIKKAIPMTGREKIKHDEHRKIAPGHPNNGRR